MCRFKAYADLVQDKLAPRFGAATHWAKLEAPAAGSPAEKQLRQRIASRFPVEKVRSRGRGVGSAAPPAVLTNRDWAVRVRVQFNAYREVLDPHNVLANHWVQALFPR